MKLLPALLGIASGVLTALGFQPWGWWPLVILGVAGLTLAVRASDSVWGSAGVGLFYGLAFNLLGIGWMQVIFLQAMVGLVLVESLFSVVLAVLLKAASGLRAWPWFAAAAWTLIEAIQARFPFNGFGWMRLGFSMIDSPIAGMLPLTGVATLGFVTALLGQAVAWLLVTSGRQRWVMPGVAVVVAASLATAGAAIPVPQASTSVSVGWVQGGAPGGGVYGLGEVRTITRNQSAETIRLAERIRAGEQPPVDFIVWPENGTDMDPFHDPQTGELVAMALKAAGMPILVGAILDGPGADERRTASLWWDPATGVGDTYIKRGIVPFGEWVPFREVLLPLIPELRYVGKQSVGGTEPGVLSVSLPDGRNLKIGVLACYDVVFDDFAYDTVIHGAQVSVVQSSNAMYQGTGQIDQQFAITRVRARELQREQLVVTTSGISGLIRTDGSIDFVAPNYQTASGVVELPVREGTTPAVWLAGWLEFGLVLLGLGGLLIGLRKTSRNRARQHH